MLAGYGLIQIVHYGIIGAHRAKAFNPNPVRLHADLGGKIGGVKKEAARLADAMRAVETVIRLFDPAYDVRVRRRRRLNPWFKRGTMFRAVLDVLKAATGPLTVREIARAVLAGRGKTDPATKVIRDLGGGFRACLSNKEGKSVERVRRGYAGAVAADWRRPLGALSISASAVQPECYL